MGDNASQDVTGNTGNGREEEGQVGNIQQEKENVGRVEQSRCHQGVTRQWERFVTYGGSVPFEGKNSTNPTRGCHFGSKWFGISRCSQSFSAVHCFTPAKHLCPLICHFMFDLMCCEAIKLAKHTVSGQRSGLLWLFFFSFQE